MATDSERAFSSLRLNQRQAKPRTRGLTEIRGPYYTPMGKRYLADVLETMGSYVDGLKFAGGSFVLMPRTAVQELLELAHAHDVRVSTGGFVERVIPHGTSAVESYLRECRLLGFDVVELSCGFITLPLEDWAELVRKVHQFGLKAKAEVGIQFGAGGASAPEALEAAGTADPAWMIQQAQHLLEAGADEIMIESEGVTECVRTWRTDVPSRVIAALGMDKVMFEAADPAVFGWYIRNYGPEVNLFIDHSQIVQLECLRSGVWGTTELWGRVHTYKGGT